MAICVKVATAELVIVVQLHPTVGNVTHNSYDSVLINGLRIGHCHLIHSYFLSGDDKPTCTFCALSITVLHILLECTNL